MRFQRSDQPVEPRPQVMMRWGIDGLLLGLVVFTPLAFGSVQPWAVGVIEWAALSVFLLRFLLHREFPEPAPSPGDPGGWLLRPLRRAGIAAAAGAFLALVVLQLVPLPPPALRVVSPTAWKLYGRTLPNYGKPGEVDFNRLESWLLEGSSVAKGDEEPLPWGAEPRPDLVFSSWRTVSLVPAATRRSLGLLLAYLMLFLVAAERCRDTFFRRRLLWTVALTGALVAMLGLAQQTTWGDRLYGRIRPAYGGSPMGPFVNRNHFAGYLEMALSVFAGLWIALLRRERDPKVSRVGAPAGPRTDQKFLPQLFMVTLFLSIGVLALWRSGSRGGLGAVGATLLLFSVVSLARMTAMKRRWKLVLAVAVLVVAAGFAWKVHTLTRQESLEPDLASEPSFGMRLRIWQASLGMLVRFVGVGTGLGTYGYVIPIYQGGGYGHLWIYAHNDYIQLLCETGALGAILVLAGFLNFWRRTLLPVLRRPLEMGGAAVGSAAGIMCILIHSLVDFNLQIPSNGLLFVLLGAVLTGVRVTEQISHTAAREHTAARTPQRRLKIVTGVALGAWLVAALLVGLVVAARSWQSAATAEFWGGKFQEADRNLRRALRIGAALPDLQADRGFLYLRALESWEEQGKELGIDSLEAVRRARDSIARAINLSPVNSNSWSGLAELYLEAYAVQLHGQVFDVSQLIQSPPGASRLERLHVAVLRRMMALEPQNPYYYTTLGSYLMERGDRGGGLGAYAEAVRLLPRLEEHPFLSGEEVPADVLQAAIRGLHRALAEGSHEVSVHRLHYYLADLYARTGDTKSAIEHMQSACTLQPEFSYYQYMMGVYLFNAGELERSREYLLRSIELGFRNELPYLMLARVASRKKDDAGSLDYYRKALAKNPDNGRLALEIAQQYERAKDLSKAEVYYEKAMDLLPTDVNVLLSVADYYTRNASVARAIPLLKKVVALRPFDEVYKQRLAQLQERAGFLE